MLKIQEFLSVSSSTEDKLTLLKKRLGVVSIRHPKYSNLIHFKYNKRFDIDWSGELIKECRGIILDEKKSWKVVSYPFYKFFNYGEKYAAKIDEKNSVVQPKLTGELCVMYAYDNDWQVSTLTSPSANGDVGPYTFSFAEFFWKTFYNMRLGLPHVDCNHCFFFELTSKYNQTVVRYKEPNLTLLGARNTETNKEISAKSADKLFGIDAPIVESYPFVSYDDVIDVFNHTDPTENEGFVAFDGINRVQLIHPGFLSLNYARGGLSRRAFLEIVRTGEKDEVLSIFPEFREICEDLEDKVEDFITELEMKYNTLKFIADQKEFANEALKTKCSGAMFAMRAKQTKSVRDYIMDMRLEYLAIALKLDQAS
jgi:hypothetical protein